jgi:hypothetical protein
VALVGQLWSHDKSQAPLGVREREVAQGGPPIDALVPELRSLLEARVGRAGVFRTALPICGTMEVDVPGTAQGMWLLDGEDVPIRGDTADRFFALANDDLRPDADALTLMR